MSYQASVSHAVENAGKFLKLGGMDAVKVEGGRERIRAVEAILDAGIPVLGHLGLTPQSVHQLGGFKTQGKTAAAGIKLLEDALVLQEAGCFGIVLESIPHRLAADISHRLEIPTIGIGAGSGCDGQVLVTHDLLGFDDSFQPKFLKQYARLSDVINRALKEYQREVTESVFPASDHTYQMADKEWEEYQQLVEEI
jgi:3-methyl-2-oxobutanoate hydroxymethyltransferase